MAIRTSLIFVSMSALVPHSSKCLNFEFFVRNLIIQGSYYETAFYRFRRSYIIEQSRMRLRLSQTQ